MMLSFLRSRATGAGSCSACIRALAVGLTLLGLALPLRAAAVQVVLVPLGGSESIALGAPADYEVRLLLEGEFGVTDAQVTIQVPGLGVFVDALVTPAPPGIPPTGKRVEVPLVAIVHFRDDKLAHEHIYWDQASVLVQLGLLDTEKLPVLGAITAAKVLDNSIESNALIERADRWKRDGTG